MDHSSTRLPRSSGIPRLSKLPIPQKQSISGIDSAKSTLTRKAVPQKTSPDVQHNPAFAKTAERTINQPQQAEPNLLIESSMPVEPLRAENIDPPYTPRTLPRRPRPSLSDRTIETLSQIPPSPSPGSRKSSFFTSESPAVTSSRPGSSLSRSRPGTSSGQYGALTSGFPTPRPQSPTKRPLVPSTGNQILSGTPSKRAVSSYVRSSMPQAPSSGQHYSNADSTPSKSKTSVPTSGTITQKESNGVASRHSMRSVGGSKTLAARPSKQRPSAQDTFTVAPPKIGVVPGFKHVAERRKPPSFSSADHGEDAALISSTPKKSYQTSSKPVQPASSRSETSGAMNSPKSSAALREQIAKAKAARRVASQSSDKVFANPKQGTEDFPDFEIGVSNKLVLRKRIASARSDGRLNIAAQGLKEIPKEVMNMYNIDLGNAEDGAWYESVDLVRLLAADNEFEYLQDEFFPDDAADAHSMDDDYQGNVFGGLETLDLHGNRLKTLPLGFRRLEHLTVLNLSKNSLSNSCLEVMSQISSLRELRLAENALDGTLDSRLSNLTKLEILGIQDNTLSALPSNLDGLSNLRVLQIAGNRLTALPLESLAHLPLVELDAARNKLSGSLFPSSIDMMHQLKSLNVASNALTSLTSSGVIHFPALQYLNLNENRLAELPDMSEWTNLLNLAAGGNKLSSFPGGITSLQKLKSADFSMNNIKKMDERFGLMESLTALRVANNPLRERKFLTMETEEMKRELLSRVLPTVPAYANTEDGINRDGTDPATDGNAGANELWPVKPGGTLDRSYSSLEAIELSKLEPLVQCAEIKSLILHNNLLLRIPHAIVVVAHSLTFLDLSHNKLSNNNYLGNVLSLLNLKVLDLSFNSITSLNPLLGFLSAPKLTELNVSRNRLTGLPILRNNFPSLTSLFASDNKISELQVEAVRGLQVLDVTGNELGHLEPKLGLLGTEGLRTFLVGGNTFRVPRRDVLDKGTGAVLTYLRGRIPEEELASLE